jgi:two-component SAPR family response regulator
MNVMLVEIENSTISDLKAILLELGHEVVGLSSIGKDAIVKARDLNPDIILINIKLKGEMSGVETARKIVSLYKIPIIFITVFTKNCLTKSLQLPEDAITISKPIKKEHLKYCFSRAFSKL